MNCPEHLVLDRKYCQIWHIQSADIRREYVAWREVLNPLRYEICIGAGPGKYWHWNNDAWMNRSVLNFFFRLRKMCWLRGHDFRVSQYSTSGGTCVRCFKRKHLKEQADG